MYRDAKIPTLYHCMKRWSKKSAFKSALYILPLMTKKADQKKSAFAPSFYRSYTRVINTFFSNFAIVNREDTSLAVKNIQVNLMYISLAPPSINP